MDNSTQEVTFRPTFIPTTESCHKHLPVNVRTIYIIVLFITGVLICTGNGLFIVAYIRSDKLSSLRTKAIYLLVHLSCADLLVGFSIPYHISIFWIPELEHQSVTCALRYISIIFPISASVGFLLLVSIDRAVAILWPLKYQIYMTDTKIKIGCAFVWLASFILGVVGPIVSYQPWNSCDEIPCDLAVRFHQIYFTIFLLPLLFTGMILIITVYIVIVISVRRQGNFRNGANECLRQREESVHMKQHIKVLITGVIVVGIFCICYMPFLVIFSIQTYGHKENNKQWSRCKTIATFLAIANSFMNAFVYAWRLPFFFQTLKQIICWFHCAKLRKVSQQDTVSSTERQPGS